MTVPVNPDTRIDTTLLHEAARRLEREGETRAVTVLRAMAKHAESVRLPDHYGSIYVSPSRADELRYRRSLPIMHPDDLGEWRPEPCRLLRVLAWLCAMTVPL